MTAPPSHAHGAALKIVGALRDAGHVALFAGGCVRDQILGLEPKDYDIATDALPTRVCKLFHRTRAVGAKFGVILVHQFGHAIEVATFRSDGSYSDGRRPDDITFGTPEEDACRRDFTVNGLFFDPIDERIIDYVGGRADLDARLLRAIGDAEVRFGEDHLRMLRAVRFAARFGLTLHPPTAAAIRDLSHHLRSISAERIWQELELILTAPSRAIGWSLLSKLHLRSHLAPAWVVEEAQGEVAMRRLTALPPHRLDAALPLASVLMGIAPRTVSRLSRELRLSNRMISDTAWLLAGMETARRPVGLALADVKLLVANPGWRNLLILFEAELTATQASIQPLDMLRARADAIDPQRLAPPPLLTGEDLLALGMSQGPAFGRMLSAVYRAQLNEEIDDTEGAMAMARMQMGQRDAQP